MSELNLNAGLSAELLNAASTGSRPVAVQPGTADWARREGGIPADAAAVGRSALNPFAALLSGVLQGAQPPAPATAPATAASTPVNPLLTSEAAAGTTELLGLPAGAGAATPSPDTTSPPAPGALPGNALPPTGRTLPPLPATTPGERTTTAAQAPNAPDPDDRLTPAVARPGVSLADLAYSRQLAEAPVVATTHALDSARSATAIATGGRPAGSTRFVTSEPGIPAAARTAELASSQVTSAEPVPPSTSTDALALRLSVADLMRNAIIPGADVAGRQLAAFAAGDNGRGGSSDHSSLQATGNGSSALLRQLGTNSLPGLQPLGDPGAFTAGLADRLLMLGGPGAHSARLKLYPEHLGELKVDIRIDGGKAEVSFATTSPQAREAIEGSLPRLRELFAEQGIQLTRTQVDAGTSQPGYSGSDARRRMAGDGPFEREPGWRAAPGATPVSGLPGPTGSSTANRLLDVWA